MSDSFGSLALTLPFNALRITPDVMLIWVTHLDSFILRVPLIISDVMLIWVTHLDSFILRVPLIISDVRFV
jgi:hypothetical protein